MSGEADDWAERFPELAHPALGALEACRVCGVRRHRKDDEAEWVQDVDPSRSGPWHWVRDEQGAPRPEYDEQAWRWRHVACELRWSWVLAQVLGLELTEEVARAAAERSGVALLARHANAVGRRPFQHVGAEQREQLRRSVGRELANRSPRRSTHGRCGLCGTSRSMSWRRVAFLEWDDRSTAPACEACAPVLRLVDTSEDTGIAIAALAAMTGVRPNPELRRLASAMRWFAAIASEDEREEDGHAGWDYRPAALAELRREAYARHPELLVDDGRRRIHQKLQAVRRYRAEKEAAERAQAATPGGGKW